MGAIEPKAIRAKPQDIHSHCLKIQILSEKPKQSKRRHAVSFSKRRQNCSKTHALVITNARLLTRVRGSRLPRGWTCIKTRAIVERPVSVKAACGRRAGRKQALQLAAFDRAQPRDIESVAIIPAREDCHVDVSFRKFAR